MMAAMDDAPLRLAAIDAHNWRDTLTVRVADEQLSFVAGHQPVALVVLAKAYVRPDGLDWEPLAVVRGDRVVGVLALAHAATHSELLHLAVDASQQGRGVGTDVVGLVVAHLGATRPACREVRLTVHPENDRALRLYGRNGFRPTGEHRDGEPVWSKTLTPARPSSPSGPPPRGR